MSVTHCRSSTSHSKITKDSRPEILLVVFVAIQISRHLCPVAPFLRIERLHVKRKDPRPRYFFW